MSLLSTMRGLVPLDMHKATLASMTQQGLPEVIAKHILRNKPLWMITMHPDDISKVYTPTNVRKIAIFSSFPSSIMQIHIADLRGSYDPRHLDLVEIQALWHWLQERDWFDGPVDKLEWMYGMKNKVQELEQRNQKGLLTAAERRNAVYKVRNNTATISPHSLL